MTIRPLEYVLVIGLAAFRVSRMLAVDALLDGPRHRMFKRFPPNDFYRRHYKLAGKWQVGEVPQRRRSLFGTWVSCMWCSSVWFCAAFTYATSRFASVSVPVLVWVASCSVAGIFATLTS